jgi:hypothetical protein
MGCQHEITYHNRQISYIITNTVGSQIYITAEKNLLQTLDPIHTEGIRLSIGAFRTSPTDSILCYAGELPFNLLKEKDLLYYGIKRNRTPDHIGYNNIFNKKTLKQNNFNKEPHTIHS